jgi:tetratricopeptide (TPR) repeat protein
LIWRGRWHLNRFTREDSKIARKLFAEALQLEPNSPEALIQATWCELWTLWAERGSEEQIAEVRKLAHRAIIADCDDSRGHMLAGIAEAWLRQPARAIALIGRAIELNPSLALAHAQLGDCYYLAGEPEKAIQPLKTALRLSPNDMHLFFTLGELACTYCMLSRWREAIDHAEQSLVRRPAYWFAHVVKINALWRSGNLEAARRAFEELRAAAPKFDLGYIDWIPFIDRNWNRYFAEGIVTASNAHPSDKSDGRRASP